MAEPEPRTEDIPPARVSSCDWGGCDNAGFAFAYDPHEGWLPVCPGCYRQASFDGYQTRADLDPRLWRE